MGMSGFAVPARSSEALVDLVRRESFPLPATTTTTTAKDANNSINNKAYSLKPGSLVVVSVDPVATLQPLFEDDDAIEKAAWEMYPRMRKYVGFLRDVGSLQQPTSEDKELEEEEPITSLFGTGVHLNLLHTQRPTRSRYDTIDESMCVPLCIERPASPSSSSSGSPSSSLSVTPQRQNSRRHPGFVRTNTRRPLPIHTTKDALPWRELYAHTIMDAFTAVSHVNDTPPRGGEYSSFSISPKDMQRYDGYQAFDRARESSQYSKVQANGGAPEDYVDDWEADEDEDEEDESQFRLSTVISGLTIEEDYSVKDAPMSFAPSLRLPPSRVGSPIGSGAAPSAWKGKPIRSSPQQQQQQQQRPQQQDYMTAKDSMAPSQLPEPPLSPKSPTMTGTSGETSESKNTIFSSTSTQATSLSTHATTFPEHVFPPSPAPCEHEATAAPAPAPAEEEPQSTEAAPWSFSQIELGGGLGANKPTKRQCAIHVRVWLDLGTEDIREPEDPRTFFEELKMLRALERTSDMRYVAQQKQANAQRVLAWRSSTQSKPIKSASKSTLSLNNPFSSTHGKHLSGGTIYHNPFKMRRTSMPSASSKPRKPSFLLTNSLHAPAFLLDRRRSSSALQGAATATAVLTVEHSNSMVSSLKRLWKRLACRPTK